MMTLRLVVVEQPDGSIQTAVYVDPDQHGTSEEDKLMISLHRQVIARLDEMLSKTQNIQTFLKVDEASDELTREIHKRYGKPD